MLIITKVGDSETYGLGLTPTQTWGYQLCQLLDGGTPTVGNLTSWTGALSTTAANRRYTGTNYEVRNAGVSSDTSRGGRARFLTDVFGEATNPHIVIITFGENDAYNAATETGNDPTYGLHYSPGGFAENMAAMAQMCRDHGAVPVFGTPTPHGTVETEPNRYQIFQDILKWLGSSMGWLSSAETKNTLNVPLVDFYKSLYDPAHPSYAQNYPTGSVYEQDNIHPNAAGAAVMANLVKTALPQIDVQLSTAIVAGTSLSATLAPRPPKTFDLSDTFRTTPEVYDLSDTFRPATETFDLAAEFFPISLDQPMGEALALVMSPHVIDVVMAEAEGIAVGANGMLGSIRDFVHGHSTEQVVTHGLSASGSRAKGSATVKQHPKPSSTETERQP